MLLSHGKFQDVLNRHRLITAPTNQDTKTPKQATSRTMDLFHYTDKAGYKKISSCGYILPSKEGKHGEGVYLTTLNPSENDKLVIAKSNYETGG